MKAVVKVDIVDGKCVVIYSDGSEQELYDVSDDTGGGGEAVLGTKNITSNGSYTARSDGYDGYSKVNVNVPTGSADLGTKNIVTNGTYNASSDNLDGYSSVNVNVPTGITPTGTKQITISENGTTTEDVTNYANAQITVSVPSDGITLKGLAENTQPSGAITLPTDVTTIGDYAFAGKPITSIIAPNVTLFGGYSFYRTNITALSDVNFPALPNGYVMFIRINSLETFESSKTLSLVSGSGAFKDCTALRSVRIPNASEITTGTGCFQNDSNLEIVDLGNANIGNNCFYGCNKLRTIILRKATVATLNSNALSSAAYFKNGGAGGDVYVPSALIESYKTANAWSTFYGYGTITFRAIEGSEYEL